MTGMKGNTFSNHKEMEMSESEDVRIELHGSQSQPTNDNIVREWHVCLLGNETTQCSERKRKMQKIPSLLLEGKKGRRKHQYYEPVVVSLGPYHHNRDNLAAAEKYKLITLEKYSLSCATSMVLLYNKVSEVLNDARSCYIDGSTDEYNDDEFTRMMLRDGCFILCFIECMAMRNKLLLLNLEYLGAMGFSNITRDIFLLENQIPFIVLQALLDLRFPVDRGEHILKVFFNYLKYGEQTTTEELVLGKRQPLHLLELYRSYFISLSPSYDFVSYKFRPWKKWRKITAFDDEDWNYVRRNRWLASVMELKDNWIFVKPNYHEFCNTDINFHSNCWSGELALVPRAAYGNSKVIYLNMIAYEMCPHNPNDFRVSTYIRVMKSLVIHPDDVKELRRKNILVHSIGRDEEVVKMYNEIDVPVINVYVLNQLLGKVQMHCDNKYKMWIAELIKDYFSGPWKTVALLAATAVLFSSFLQTYFTIRYR